MIEKRWERRFRAAILALLAPFVLGVVALMVYWGASGNRIAGSSQLLVEITAIEDGEFGTRIRFLSGETHFLSGETSFYCLSHDEGIISKAKNALRAGGQAVATFVPSDGTGECSPFYIGGFRTDGAMLSALD